MIDVQFDDAPQVMRRSAKSLTDVDPDKDHLRRWRQRVYEGLVKQELKVKEFYTPKGRIDVLALESGRLTRDDVDRLVSRAFAAVTVQGRKPLTVKGKKVTGGWIHPGTQTPTGRAKAAAAEDREDAAHHAERIAQYELTLSLRRKKNPSDTFYAAQDHRTGATRPERQQPSFGYRKMEAMFLELRPTRSNPRRNPIELTDTAISVVPAHLDPDGHGYAVLTYDPRRGRTIDRVLNSVHGWRHVSEITAEDVQRGTEVKVRRGEVVVTAPSVHRVLPHGRGHHSVVGPRAKARDVYGSKTEAQERAKQLDREAHRLVRSELHGIEQTHKGAWIVTGPNADDHDYPDLSPVQLRALRVQALADAAREQQAYSDYSVTMMTIRRKQAEAEAAGKPYHPGKLPTVPKRTAWDAIRETEWRGPFATEEEAERGAKKLDRMASRQGVVPIAGKRTKPGMSADKVVEKVSETVAALLDNNVYLARFPSPIDLQNFASDTKMVKRAAEKQQARYAPTVFHKLTYKQMREVLKDDYDADEIAKIIEAEKYNRAMIEYHVQRQAQLEAGRLGKRPGEYIERKEVK